MSEKQTITVLTQANKALAKTTGDLYKVMTNLNNLVNVSGAMADKIALKQAELDAIEEKMDVEHRKAVAELKLRILEDEKKELERLLKKFSLAEITIEELEDLNEELSEAKTDYSETVEKAVSQAEKVLHASYGSKIAALNAEHKVNVAQKDADKIALELQIGFLKENVESLEETIRDEREARIRIAEAESKKLPVSVNTATK